MIMAFHLNVQGSYPKARRISSSAAQILGVRNHMRLNNNVGYFESPKMHVMTAVLTFFIGVTMASLRLGQLATAHNYDMTPTGSIAAKASPADGKHRSCE
jgi:hypothetical protein